MLAGGMLDGTTRLSFGGATVHHYCFLSSFAERAVVPERSCIRIPEEVPFEIAALVGCAVTSGVGAVWRTAGVRPGERVAIFGLGGTGIAAVRISGPFISIMIAMSRPADCDPSRIRRIINRVQSWLA